jgi:hypothetical protein
MNSILGSILAAVDNAKRVATANVKDFVTKSANAGYKTELTH